ncbi:MFS transporter, partial [[Kitasatospora] papulosa]
MTAVGDNTAPGDDAAQPAPRAGRKEWLALGVLVLPLLLTSMDMWVLYFAVRWIWGEVHRSCSEQVWMIEIYGFV